ncbi:transmembrane protein, putative, partial [Bodo saltans]
VLKLYHIEGRALFVLLGADMVVWLFLMVMRVATGFDIDCNNITASPLSLNVTAAPSVRILNCTRRIEVSVPCGMDKDHLMRVEVVGGTMVPVFTLLSCTVHAALSFSFATLTIRNVLMPSDPANALDLQASSLFATLSVFTLSITLSCSGLRALFFLAMETHPPPFSI